MADLRKRFLILGLLIVLALAVGIALVLYARATRQSSEEGATYAIAQAYIAAVIEGHKRAALRLYSADALCSPADSYVSAKVDEHIALLASSEVRDICIRVEPREGIDVMPGSESAEILFRYRSNSEKVFWRSGTIWLITGPPHAKGERSICHLGGG